MNSFWTNGFFNPTIWAAFCAWLMAQIIKSICFIIRTHRVNFGYLISPGGMPSSHSAMAAALVTSVALRNGTGNSLFAVTLAFAIVVMFDAQSVRRAAGLQAQILNQILDELFKKHRLSERRLVELLGHTPFEVLVGMIIGVLVAMLIHAVFVI